MAAAQKDCVVDYPRLAESLGIEDDDKSFIIEMLQEVIQEQPTRSESLTKALDRGHGYSEIRQVGHTLKGQNMTLCLPNLSDVSKEIEDLGRDLEVAEAEEICATAASLGFALTASDLEPGSKGKFTSAGNANGAWLSTGARVGAVDLAAFTAAFKAKLVARSSSNPVASALARVRSLIAVYVAEVGRLDEFAQSLT